MAKELFELYLRKDKTFLQLLEMAKQNYFNPPLSDHGPGLLLMTIPISVQDCVSIDLFRISCKQCHRILDLKYYRLINNYNDDQYACEYCVEELISPDKLYEFFDCDEETKTYVKENLEQNENKLTIEDKLELVDYKQLRCSMCETYALDDEEYIYYCENFNRCISCSIAIESMQFFQDTAIIPDICNTIFSYLTNLTWKKEMKNSNSSNLLVLRSKFLTKDELVKFCDEILVDDDQCYTTNDYCSKIVNDIYSYGCKWLEKELKNHSIDVSKYSINCYKINWYTGYRFKLHYRESFSQSIMIKNIISHLYEQSIHFKINGIYLNPIYYGEYIHDYKENLDDDRYDDRYDESKEKIECKFMLAFKEMNHSYAHLLPTVFTKDVLKRLHCRRADGRMLIELRKITHTD